MPTKRRKITKWYYEAYMVNTSVCFYLTTVGTVYRDKREWEHDQRTMHFIFSNVTIAIKAIHGDIDDDTLEAIAVHIWKKHYFNYGLAKPNDKNGNETESMGNGYDATVRKRQRKLPLN